MIRTLSILNNFWSTSLIPIDLAVTILHARIPKQFYVMKSIYKSPRTFLDPERLEVIFFRLSVCSSANFSKFKFLVKLNYGTPHMTIYDFFVPKISDF